MKKKLVFLSIIIFLALVVSVGAYAYTYSTDVTTIGVAIAGEEIATSAPAPAPDQPEWYAMLPQQEFGSEFLIPNGRGDLNGIQGQYPDTGEHWEKMVSADGDNTYVYTATLGWDRDLYDLTDHTEEGTILAVRFFAVVRAEDVPPRTTATVLMKTNGTVYEGPEETVTTDYAQYSYQWDINPKTGDAWTWADIDALQAGVQLRRVTNGVATRATQVYVLVDFELPPVIEGEVPSGELYTVTPTDNYTGDLMVKVYLTNTGPLSLALKYLNMKLYVAGSIEADKTPDYQLLTFENGVATFNIQQDGSPESYTVEVVGGSYRLVSGDANDWVEGWTIVPEFYIEVTQRGIL